MGKTMSIDEYYPIFIDNFRHLGNVKEQHDKFSCVCPICGDTRGKFQITNAHDKIIMNCFNCVGDGGFNYVEALNAVGLKKQDLYPPKEKRSIRKTQIEQREHIYRNPDGDVFAKKIIKKYDDTSKDVYWKRYENGKYINGLNKQKAPLFRIDEVLSVSYQKIYVVEGEKDVDTLISMDLVATTFPNGGGQTTWIDSYSKPFKDKQVIILTDNDDVGKKYGVFVSSHVSKIAKNVCIIPSTDIYQNIGKKGDITDIVDLVGIKEAKRLLLEAEKNTEPLGLDRTPDLSRFHTFTGRDQHPADTIDAEIVDDILMNHYIRVMDGIPYIYCDGVLRQDKAGTQIKSVIKNYIYKQLQTINRINRIYGLLVIQQDIQITLPDCNTQPKHWINFINGFLDVRSLELIPHTGKQDQSYNCLNQIPLKWCGNPKHNPSISRKFIAGLIPDNEDRKMLYQFIGYSMTTDTSLQKFLIIAGEGQTGKSTLLSLVINLFGGEKYNNISNLKLQQVGARFHSAKLMGKLMNICAEINGNDMEDISTLKMITGEDICTGEYKGGEIFSFYSYARLLFSANKIPKNRDDRTNAYYRRLLIIRVKQRGEYIPDLVDGLKGDIDQFSYDCVMAYHEVLSGQPFTVSRNSKKAVMDLYLSTDTVFAFLHEKTIKLAGNKLERSYLFEQYVRYCERDSSSDEQIPHVWAHTFYDNLRDRGYSEVKINGVRYFVGLAFAPEDYEPPEIELDQI